MRAQQLRAAAEEDVEVLPADRLDHLDRDELVVAAPEVAVVDAEDLDPASSPAARTRASAYSRCSREIVVVVTRQP